MLKPRSSSFRQSSLATGDKEALWDTLQELAELEQILQARRHMPYVTVVGLGTTMLTFAFNTIGAVLRLPTFNCWFAILAMTFRKNSFALSLCRLIQCRL
jgi:hypothetical protein